MMRDTARLTMIRTLTLTALLGICTCVVAQSVSPTPNRSLVPPGPQRPAPPQQGQQRSGTTAPPPIRQIPSVGTIEGFVYWDANAVAHKPASDCSGLAVTVSVATSSDRLSKTYTPLGTLNNNFKYVGQVKTLLAGGKVNVYDVCTYGYDRVPVGPDLEVTVSVPNPLLFSPYVAPQNANVGPIQIINAKCNMLPSFNPSTIAELTAHWGSCQNMAYDVNFQLAPASHLLSSGGVPLPSGSSARSGLLSGSQPQGMLAGGAPSSPQSQPASGTLLGPAPTPGVPSKLLLNGQPAPARTPGKQAPISLQELRARLAKIPGMKVRTGPRVKNPALATLPILTTLKMQSQMANIEAGRVMSAGNTSAGAGIRATAAPAAASSAAMAPPLASSPASPVYPVSGTNSSRYATEPMNPRICLAGSVGIVSVNQRRSGAVFTPDPGSNHYTIVGCGFGSAPGKIYLIAGPSGFPAHSGKVMLFPYQSSAWGNHWSDGFIDAQVDPNVVGELDQQNVSLVIESTNGNRGQADGFSFYAKRAEVLLQSVPPADVALYPKWSPYYLSPDGSTFGSTVTLSVYRTGMTGKDANELYYANYHLYPPDVINLKLKPGFVIDSTQSLIFGNGMGSGASGNLEQPWHHTTVINGSEIQQVFLISQYLDPSVDGGYGYFSTYGLAIWVVGPAGISQPLLDAE